MQFAVSDSDTDSENEAPPPPQRRRKVYRPRPNHLELFDEKGFQQRFRLSKNTVMSILERIGDALNPPSDRNFAISPIQQLLLTLRFYAMGSMLITAGDFAGVSVSSACRIVWRVTKAIAGLKTAEIKFPANHDTLIEDFFEVARFPRVIGTIDCTHVRVQSPGGDQAEIFRNRKDYFSINVQTIADKNLKILNIVARWPGSAHDATIFDNSVLKDRLERGEFGNNWLLGDSAYPLKDYLLTPILRPATEGERLYNKAHIATRNCVERSYGVWKRRFPVMSLKMRLKMERLLAVIVATAVLHNIAVDNKEPQHPPEVEILSSSSSSSEEENEDNNIPNQGQTNRARLVRDYFTPLADNH